MQVFPVKTRIIVPEDNFVDVLLESLEVSGLSLLDNDIITIAETPLGTTEERCVKLSEVQVTDDAIKLSENSQSRIIH